MAGVQVFKPEKIDVSMDSTDIGAKFDLANLAKGWFRSILIFTNRFYYKKEGHALFLTSHIVTETKKHL